MSKGKKTPHSRKRVIGIMLIGAILTIGVGILAWTKLHPEAKRPTTQSGKQEITVRAADDIEKDIMATNDRSKKSKLYSELVKTQQLNGNQDAAFEASVKANEAKETANGYAVIAGLYQEKGDNAKAIEYFKKAMALSEPTSDPNLNVPYNNYKQYILALGGSI